MHSLSALELAARIRRRELSSEDAVRACLDRIARLDPELASFTDVRHYGALRDARRKDRAPADAPFHGVPIGVKDLNLVRGTYTRFGSRAYKWLVSPVDDDVAKAVKRAGFVIVGKLATSEFGTMPITEPDIHLPTRNPWGTDHTSGGSSGGSGAAVAAGLLPLAHGSDGGGSIRIPSAFCHLYGFKTTRGLCPLAQGKVDRTGLGVEGPLGHTVDDAAAFVAALAGRPVPACRPTPGRLRVRFTTVAGIAPTAPEHAAATERLAAVLADLGHDVQPTGPLVGTLAEFLPIWARMSADLPIPREATLQPVTRWLREIGRRSSHADAQQRHGELAARIHAWWDDADLVLTPTVGGPPPRVGAFRGLDPEAQFAAIAPIGQFTAPFNVAGNPAASIPVGVGADGLPIGVQLVGRVGEDALVLDVSRRLEEAVPWRARRASLAA